MTFNGIIDQTLSQALSHGDRALPELALDHLHSGMFLPRSVAKRATKSTVASENPKLEPPAPSNRAVSQASSSNSKKRNIHSGGQSSDDSSTDASSDSDSESDDGSDSESGSSSDSGDKPTPPATVGESSSSNKPPNGPQLNQSEIAARLELALSDISLWRTESLYQRLAETSDWYIPFSRLHDHPLLAPIFEKSSTRIPDATLVNALRTYGSGIFEFQMKIRAPSNAAWKGKSRESAGWVGAAGGYEIRCKSWAQRAEGWMEQLSATDEQTWQTRMVYIERVPTTIRSIWTLYHFIASLGRLDSPNESEAQIVHDVFVPTADPSLTQQQLEPPRRFRGQAFVVFATEQLARAFCTRWNWNASREATTAAGKPVEIWSTESANEAATSCGFRAMTKANWDKLKAEYLEHQARVLRQAPRERRKHVDNGKESPSGDQPPTGVPPAAKTPVQHHQPRQTYAPPPFPPGILVFVRRLHPETNKTTLKTLFSRAFKNGNGHAIEYLDFQKGIDSAHVRLRTPTDASTLSTYFTSTLLTQRDGLDDSGQPATKSNAIEAEVVLGTREANYWAKVPEKVRMAAVAKAGLAGDGDGGEGGGKSRRKRQRKT